MKFLCLDIPQPGAAPEKYQPHLLEETRHAWKLYKSGIVSEIYFRQDRAGVAIIVECESIEAARSALMAFPLAEVGLISWEIIPINTFFGWEALFASQVN